MKADIKQIPGTNNLKWQKEEETKDLHTEDFLPSF